MKKPDYKTFNEWSSLGYTINKRSKGKKQNGKFYFHSSQVSKRFNQRRYSIWESYSPDEEPWESGDDWFDINDFGDN